MGRQKAETNVTLLRTVKTGGLNFCNELGGYCVALASVTVAVLSATTELHSR